MRKTILILSSLFLTGMVYGQQFEWKKDSAVSVDKKVKVGGDFAIQYQSLSQKADSALIPLGNNINLPTANLNLDAQLAPGISVNLVTYLSSRHHNEAWVKGGYLLMDRLPFIKSDFVNNIMDYLTIKVGVMELNYGDAHFRRSDNGNVINNPFVGNYVMDAFTTAPAMEFLVRAKGVIAMAALSTGNLKPALTGYSASTKKYTAYNAADELAFYWKTGYENKFLNNDLTLRATISGFNSPKTHGSTLYGGDRTGSRYYLVMNRETFTAASVDITSGHLSGNWSPGTLTKDNSLMLNLFGKYKGAEIFGTYEKVTGTNTSNISIGMDQIALEGLYRFGSSENFFTGVRYNKVEDTKSTMEVKRMQAIAGWYMLKSVIIKVEYVKQDYTDFISSYGAKGSFNGVMVESAISF
jgi:hypothetical protein